MIQDSIWVHCESQRAIHLATDHMYHKRTKHIDVRYHKIHQWVMDGKVIDLLKISTKKNPTNMMTKTILVKKFRASLNFIKVLQRYIGEWVLGGIHVKSQKRGESKANKTEVNFYGGTQ